MPPRPANTYSGDSAMPTISSSRRLPLTMAASRLPGSSPRAVAKASETSASSASLDPGAEPPATPAAPTSTSARPERSTTWLSRGGCSGSSPISWPITASAGSSVSMRTPCSMLTCTSATPGIWRSPSTSASGARRTEANTSAKCASA